MPDFTIWQSNRSFDTWKSPARGGEHYVTALELYDAAELAKAQAAQRAAALAVEAERLAAERAAAEAERAALAAAALPAAMPEMVVIPAETFRMGCVSGQDCEDDEFPVHDVTIPEAFEVSVYEVTFAQWDACVAGRRLRRVSPVR